MKHTLKKSLSVLLSLLLVLSLFGGLNLWAFAQDEVLEIRNVDDWNRFVNSAKIWGSDYGVSYRGKTVRLLDDVGPVTERFSETFDGTFDGGGHTLTVDIGGGGLFEKLDGGSVKNLTVAGAFSNLNDRGALVDNVVMGSDCVISNVRITADVASSGGTVAGFVGSCDENSSLLIEDSAFEGGLFGNTVAGFIGSSADSSIRIQRSVFSGYYENAKHFSTIGYTGAEGTSSATIQNVKTNAPDVIGDLEWWRLPLYSTALPTDAGYSAAAARSLIARIGTVEYTAACKAKIDKARAVYDTLSDADKALVTNYTALTAAEDALSGYEFGACGENVAYVWNKTMGKVVIDGTGPMYDDEYGNWSPFARSEEIDSIVIAEGVTNVGAYAFLYSKATNVTIPKSVSSIGDCAFAMTALDTVNYTGSEEDWKRITFGVAVFTYTSDSPATTYNWYYGAEGAMNAISAIGTVTYDDDCKGRIDEARKAYDRLSDYESTLVTNHETLLRAEDTYKALEVEALIAAIGTVELTDEIQTKIAAALAAYDALTEEQKALVNNYAALTDAQTAYAKADAKEALAAYKNADDYRADEQTALAEAIAAGEAAIDAATDADAVATALANAKAAIDDIKTDAELTEEELAADQAAADAVEAKIAAIGKVTYTAACKAKIDDAQAAFDALTDAQKALVENKGTLDAAAKKYAELKAEAEKPAEPDKPTEPEEPEEESDKLANILTAVMELVKFICLKLIPFLVSLTK